MCGSIVIAAIVNPFFMIPVFIIALIFVFIQLVYLKTSMNIKRLEGIGGLKNTLMHWRAE